MHWSFKPTIVGATPTRSSNFNMTLVEEIEEFLKAHKRNQWFEDDQMKVYIRRAFHRVNSQTLANTLDIASIEVDEKLQGQGIFTRFIAKMEILADKHGLVVYVESVMNTRLAKFLNKIGYIRTDEGWNPAPCFARIS